MLRLQRPPEPSALRRSRSRQLARVLLGDLSARDAVEGGYNLPDVRQGLACAQRGAEDSVRCAYCGREIAKDYFPIEHFRPRNGWNADGYQRHAGYWWLAWTWENLWLACPKCNGKSSRFCLADETRRLGAPTLAALDDAFMLAREDALLLDPGVDDPQDHMRFIEDKVEGWHWEGITERGEYTIRVLNLSPGDWSSHLKFLNRELDALRRSLDADAQDIYERWMSINEDFFDPMVPYRDQLWWYVHDWYSRLPEADHTRLGGMHPFPNAYLEPQPPAQRIHVEWWPLQDAVELDTHLREWLDSLDADTLRQERREVLWQRCLEHPCTVRELEELTGEKTVRADLNLLVDEGRIRRVDDERPYRYEAIEPDTTR